MQHPADTDAIAPAEERRQQAERGEAAGAASLAPGMSSGVDWRLAVWLLVTLRIGLECVGVLGLRLQSVTAEGGDWLNLIDRGGPWTQLLSLWQRWDALWYQEIATHGYHASNSTVAFYPLYPLLARGLSYALGRQIVWAELIVASAAFAAAMWLLYHVARFDAEPAAATLTVLLTAFFPVGFFLLAPYTESLYLALTLAAFWCSRRGWPWLAGVAGFAAALTRAQGAILALPLAFDYLRNRHEMRKLPGPGLIAAALPGLGFLAVAAYDRLVVHGATGLAALAAWGYRAVPPWTAIHASWQWIAGRGDPIEALNLICLLGFGALALFAGVRLPFAYVLYLWPYLAVLATREMDVSPLASVSRYTLVLFPCFLLVALTLARRPWLAAGWLVVSLLLQAVLFNSWVHFGFIA